MGNKPNNTVITLTVTTAGLTTDQTNINNHVVFTDNQSDPKENPGHPDTYLSAVNKGKICQWRGVSEPKGDKINIISVVKKKAGGNDILMTPIPGGVGDKGSAKILTAQVSELALIGEEQYTVNFTVKNDPTVYPVDPRLKMNT